MEFEQILIRLGLDYRAVTSGLQQAGSYIKGWATNLAYDMKHHVLGSVAGIIVVEKIAQAFEKIGEKALFLRRLSKETGLGTNFLQGSANELGFVGESFEKMEKPMGRLNVLFGQAKMGIAESRQKLVEWGIVTKASEIDSLTMERGLIRLKKRFDELGGHDKGGALLQSVFGKGYQAMVPLFELEMKKFEAMGHGNFFNKLSPMTIETFAQMNKTGKSALNVGSSIFGNIAGGVMALNPIIMMARVKDLMSLMVESRKLVTPKQIEEFFQTGKIEGLSKEKDLVHATNEEFMDQIKLREELNERQRLQNELLDKNKLTVHQLAERAREIMGDKRPRGLKALQRVTPAMRDALQAENLELAAQQATAMGRSDMADSFQSSAAELRRGNMALTSVEREPMKMTEQKLESINDHLERIAGTGIKVRAENH